MPQKKTFRSKQSMIRRYYAQGLSPKEIAEKTGAKISTVYGVRYMDRKKARIRKAGKEVNPTPAVQHARETVLQHISALEAENRDLKAIIRYLESRHGSSV